MVSLVSKKPYCHWSVSWVVVAAIVVLGCATNCVVASPRTDRYLQALAKQRQQSHHHHHHHHHHLHSHHHKQHSHSQGDGEEVEEAKYSHNHPHMEHHDDDNNINGNNYDADQTTDMEEERELKEEDLSNSPHHHQHFNCGTRTPDKEFMFTEVALRESWLKQLEIQGRKLQDDPVLIVPTCIHVIRPSSSSTTVLNLESLQQQLDQLNKGFSSLSCCDTSQEWCTSEEECSLDTGIRFEWALMDTDTGLYNPSLGTTPTTTTAGDGSNNMNVCTSRTENDAWYNAFADSNEEKELKSTLRQGNGQVLNIYYNNVQQDLLGHATFPADYAKGSYLDGTVVSDMTVVGGGNEAFGEGDTLIHEVGHWMGLFHTFQGGCDIGDQIGDTPAQKTESHGCPIGQNTCQNGEGPDPIHNFMDYSDDVCLYEFSAGQTIQMKALYESHRIPRDDVVLFNGDSSAALDLSTGQLQAYLLDVEANSRIECVSTSPDDNGDADMYLSVNQPVDIARGGYVCQSEGPSTSLESCSTYVTNASTVVVSLHAWKSFQGVSVTCTSVVAQPPSVLVFGESSAAISLESQETVTFVLGPPDVEPGGTVICQTTGNNGDADLLLRWNAEPSPNNRDCYSGNNGSEELCSVEIPNDESFLWVQVLAFAAFTDVVLECITIESLPSIALSPAVPSAPVNMTAQQVQKLFLPIQSEARVTCGLDVDSGDGAMILNWQEPVSGYKLDGICQADFDTTCQVADPGLYTVLWVTVRADTNVQGLSVTCTRTFPNVPMLMNNVPSDPIFIEGSKVQEYQLTVSRGAEVTCTTTAIEGDLDLYLRFEEPPDLLTGAVDCESAGSTSEETCTVLDDAGSTILWVALRAFGSSPVENASVTCTSIIEATENADAIELTAFVESDTFSLEMYEVQSFTLAVSNATNSRVVCYVFGVDGDADLFLRYGEETDFASLLYDCGAVEDGSFELCSVRNRGGANVLWASVVAWEEVSEATIYCEELIPLPPIVLTNGVASAPISLDVSEEQSFTLDISPGDRVICNAEGMGGMGMGGMGTGDADLYVRLGEDPDLELGLYECFSTNEMSSETCTVGDSDSTVVWAKLSAYTAAQNIVVTCTATPGTATAIESGTPVGPFSLAAGEFSIFTLDINEGGRVRCDLVGDNGDPDLVLRWGSEPFVIVGQFDCASASLSSSESCVVDNPDGPEESTLWIKVSGFSQSDSVTLTCTSGIAATIITLEEGVASVPITLASGERQPFQFEVSSPAQVTCETSGINGDLDLYLRWDAVPDIDDLQYDCLGISDSATESCTVDAVGSSTILYAVLAPPTYSTVNAASITCISVASSGSTLPLFDGEASKAISLSGGGSQEFFMGVSSTAQSIYCRTFGGSDGDADLYVRYNSKPDLEAGLHDCASASLTAFEECTLPDLDGVTSIYVTVTAFTSFSDLSVLCSSATGTDDVNTETFDLALGIPSDPFSLQISRSRSFQLDLIDNVEEVDCTLSGDEEGDADLYLRFNEQPNLIQHEWDCASVNSGSNEECSITNPGGGGGNSTVVFARVFAFTSFSNVIVSCTAREVTPAPTPTSEMAADPTAAPVMTNNQPTDPTDGGGSGASFRRFVGSMSGLVMSATTASLFLLYIG